MISITKRKKVKVPDAEIAEITAKVKNFFHVNPSRENCIVQAFGHNAIAINRERIDLDIKSAADTATSYTKIT